MQVLVEAEGFIRASILTLLYRHAKHLREAALMLTLDLAGTFAFGLSGGLVGIRARLDLFGGVVGMLRDVLVREVPTVLRSALYAVPALVGAAIVVAASKLGHYGAATATPPRRSASSSAWSAYGSASACPRLRANATSPTSNR